MESHNFGLVLTGGGARAAYQAGVLRALGELLQSSSKLMPNPFRIITGESAGATNGCYLAAHKGTFSEATEGLWQVWETIQADQIFKTESVSMMRIIFRWIRDLSFGGVTRRSRAVNLLDTAPLNVFLERIISFDHIREQVRSGHLHGVAVSVTNYGTGTSVTCFDGAPEIEGWVRSNRVGKRAQLTKDLVMASTSIPILFPPIKLGKSYFGDGSIRLKSPLSPAIHLGANKIIAIGVRHYRAAEQTLELNEEVVMEKISLADIAGVLLNSVFLDNLDSDLERMNRINQTVKMIPESVLAAHPNKLRHIPVFSVRPSEDLGRLASNEFSRFSPMIRYLMRGIGVSGNRGSDLLSYLAFDSVYSKKLLKIGYEDLMRQKEDVLRFLEA